MREITVQVVLKLREDHPLRKGPLTVDRIETLMRAAGWLFVLDKDTEEFFNVSAPLGTLDALQAATQEHMCSVSGIPVV
jgi:hypothetical protein